jgi:uncharacterized DUF497 family protein
VRYEWDPAKAAANLSKHRVSFADAVTVFDDELGLTTEDPDVRNEQRFITLGRDARGVLLIVVYTYRAADLIRLISAWKADRRQRNQYEANLR